MKRRTHATAQRAAVPAHGPAQRAAAGDPRPRSSSGIDDDRLELVTVTAVDVDADLRRAIVYFDTLGGAEDDDEVLEALASSRPRLQAAVGRQARLKRTPELVFEPDPASGRRCAIEDDPATMRRRRRTVDADRRRRRAVSDRAAPAGPDGLAVVDKAAGLDVATTSWPRPGACSAPARSATRARSTPTPPACCCSAWAGSPGCCASSTALPKTYTGEIVLGVETSTLDAAGEVTATHDMAGVTLDDVRGRGRGAHRRRSCRCRRWCRRSRSTAGGSTSWPAQGIEVEREPRPVTVHRFDVEPTGEPRRVPRRGRLLVGHLRPLAGRRPRPRPRRRRPPARPAAHRHRLVHARRGPAARGPTSVRCSRRPRRCATTRRSVVDPTRPRSPSASARCWPADATGPAVHGGDGPWAVLDADGDLLAVYERRTGHGTVKPVGRAGPRRRRASRRPVASTPDGGADRRRGDRRDARARRGRARVGHHRRLRRRAPRPPRGHRRGPRRLAAERGSQTAVVTFDRHPATVVRPESAPLLLTDLDQKLELLAATGVDYTLVVHFDEARSQEPAEDFVTRGARRLPQRPGRRGGRGLPLRPPAPGQRRPAARRWAPSWASRSSGSTSSAPTASPRPSETGCRRPPSARRWRAGDVDAGHAHARPAPRGAGRGRPRRRAGPRARLPDRQRRRPRRDLPARPTASTPAGTLRPDGVGHAAAHLPRPPADVLRDAADASLLEAHLLDFDGDLYGEAGPGPVRRPAARRAEVRLGRRPRRPDGPRLRRGPGRCSHRSTRVAVSPADHRSVSRMTSVKEPSIHPLSASEEMNMSPP